MRAFSFGLFSHQPPGLKKKILIPQSSECGAARKTGSRFTIKEFWTPSTIGSICHSERRNTMIGQGFCVPEIDSWWLVRFYPIVQFSYLPASSWIFSTVDNLDRTSSISIDTMAFSSMMSWG